MTGTSKCVRDGDHELGVGGAGGAGVVIDVVHAHVEFASTREKQEPERVRSARDGEVDTRSRSRESARGQQLVRTRHALG